MIQKPFIVRQSLGTFQHKLELLYHDGMNRNSHSSLRRVRVKPEIGNEFLCCLNQRKPEKSAYEVDYVALCLTAKTVKSCIDLQRRVVVVVKGTS